MFWSEVARDEQEDAGLAYDGEDTDEANKGGHLLGAEAKYLDIRGA